MKMLFFSSDHEDVEQVSREFAQAGIRCEVRHGVSGAGLPVDTTAEELWIHNDRDCHRAMMLCVQLGVGFAKRPKHKPSLDPDEDWVAAEECQPA